MSAHRRRLVALVATLFAIAAALRPGPASGEVEASAAGARAQLPSLEQIEADGSVVGEIRIRVGEIFDPEKPGENARPYRWVNRLHPATHREVIERQLLLRPGDRFTVRAARESERLLRANHYLAAAEIRPVRYRDGVVDLEVITRDVWTLNAGLSFGRAGGASSGRFQVEDTNFLGTGTELAVEKSADVDRDGYHFRFSDPGLFSTQGNLTLEWEENSDGGAWRVDLGRPFYSLDTRWSLGVAASSEDRIDPLYTLGKRSADLGHSVERYELRGGLSRGVVDRHVTRWTVGFTYLRDRFSEVAEGEVVPPDRVLSYPWVGWDRQRDAFSEFENLDQMGRVEDVLVGPRLHARVGLSAPAFGAEATEVVFDATASTGSAPGPRQLLFLESSVGGRWGAAGLANTRVEGSSRYYLRDFGDNELFLALSGSLAEALDPENQLLLGGDSGLRGYPLRYQEGGAKVLFTAEQRFFSDWHPFRLVRVGAAVFYDVGRVWGAPEDTGFGWLQDVGVGLRLVPTRSGRGGVLHLDLAKPLNGPGDISGLQWLIGSETSF